MNKKQNQKARKTKVNKKKEEFIEQQVIPIQNLILAKRLNNFSEIEYLVEKDKKVNWCSPETLDENLIQLYEEQQKKNPQILSKNLIRICDVEVKNDNKVFKVQLEGEDDLVEISFSYLKLHAPHQLLKFLLSIYNPYM